MVTVFEGFFQLEYSEIYTSNMHGDARIEGYHVLCGNLAESKSVLKMCFSKHCREVTGFLLWTGTYCVKLQ